MSIQLVDSHRYHRLQLFLHIRIPTSDSVNEPLQLSYCLRPMDFQKRAHHYSMRYMNGLQHLGFTSPSPFDPERFWFSKPINSICQSTLAFFRYRLAPFDKMGERSTLKQPREWIAVNGRH